MLIACKHGQDDLQIGQAIAVSTNEQHWYCQCHKYLQVNGVLDVVILWHCICQTHCVAWKEGVPALHDEQLLRHYHL